MADHAKFRFALEWAAQVMNAMRAVGEELNHRQNKVIRFVQRIEHFVTRDGDCRSAGNAPFDFNETKLARARHAAFDVVTEPFKLAVGSKPIRRSISITI